MSGRPARLKLAVGFYQLGPFDEGRNVCLVSDVEERLKCPDEKTYDVQETHVKTPEYRGGRNRRQQQRSTHVAHNHRPLPQVSVDPHPHEQSEEGKGEKGEGAEDSHL